MKFFIIYLLSVTSFIWLLYYILFHTSTTGYNLLGRIRELELGLINQAAQALGRILAVLGYPLAIIEELQHQIVNKGVEFAQTTIRQIARNAFFIAWGLSVMLLILLIGVVSKSDTILMTVLIFSILAAFLTMIIYDPIIGSIAKDKKIRRSIRPIALVLAYIGVLVLLWLDFQGYKFFDDALFVFVILSLILMIFSFRSYYLLKITNTAGYTLGTILTVLLLLFVFQKSSPSTYQNLLDFRIGIEHSNMEKTVLKESPLYTVVISDNDTLLKKTFLSEGILTVKKGETVLRGEQIIRIKGEEFVDIMIKDDDELYIYGPYWIPLRWLGNSISNSAPKIEVKSTTNEVEQNNSQTENNTFTLPPGENVKVMNLPSGRENIIFRSTGRYKIIERDGPVLILSQIFTYNTRVAGGTLEVQNVESYPIQFKVEL